jgi:predicted nuclease with TOPRIM domain
VGNNHLDLTIKRTNMLQQFLDASDRITDILQMEEQGEEQLTQLQMEVDSRDQIIAEVEQLNTKLAELGEVPENLKEECNKYKWMENKLMEQIQQIEEQNALGFEKTMQIYMGKLKGAKDSIKVVDAYSRQMQGEVAPHFNKEK